jgi:uncharacterized protein YggU (UPF0235/DUF167 family)
MLVKVVVHPNSNKEEIVEKEGFLEIYVKEESENNKANSRIINLLAKKYKTDFRNIKIKNPNSRKKSIEIRL